MTECFKCDEQKRVDVCLDCYHALKHLSEVSIHNAEREIERLKSEIEFLKQRLEKECNTTKLL